jgi:Na+/proline symporter
MKAVTGFPCSTPSVLIVFCLYMGFSSALWVEQRSAEGKSPVDNSLVYSLSLAVYCTAWTYYGSVGKAATSGLLFLPIHLGPTIAITLWWIVLRKLVRIKTIHHITSIADFISARYDKSLAVGALATLIALIGTMPYTLQFKAILTTFIIPEGGPWTLFIWGLWSSAMVVFTLSCVRRLDPTDGIRTDNGRGGGMSCCWWLSWPWGLCHLLHV